MTNLPGPDAPGVQQIVLLPGPNKACILCNGVATFYSLPELSPAFGTTKVANCRWIGGIDENQEVAEGSEQVIMIAASSRVMLVRIGEEPRRVRNIEFPGCMRSKRRDTIACVADDRSYSLLEVEHQQKIPLFPISSLEEQDTSQLGNIEGLPPSSNPLPERTTSLAHHPLASPEPKGHERSTSLGVPQRIQGRQPSPRPLSQDFSGLGTPELAPRDRKGSMSMSPNRQSGTPSTPRSSTPDRGKALPPAPRPAAVLKPHIVSPTPNEFLLATGTTESDAGVGMFVNLDGDVVRGTIEFRSYPEALAVDKPGETGTGPSDDQNFCVLAIVNSGVRDDPIWTLEIHDLANDSSGKPPDTMKLDLSDVSPLGLYTTLSSFDQIFPDVSESLRLVRLRLPGISSPPPGVADNNPDPRTESSVEQVEREKALFDTQSVTADDLPRGWETQRAKDELKFSRSLARGSSRTIFWVGDNIWSVVRNPLAVQLDSRLANTAREDHGATSTLLDTRRVIALMAQIRDREAKTEAEFLSLAYIRQKASLILFAQVLTNTSSGDRESELRLVENALMESNLDPRVILLLIPFLRQDVVQGPKGIWIHQGLALTEEKALRESKSIDDGPDLELLSMIRRYLAAWQGKRGFGSITDEKQVLDSVDVALLRTLLHIDQELPPGSGAATSVHAKLNNVVDNWKGDFERAVSLIEQYHRLFVLSRLYQSRKLAKDVLATWKRIIEGEHDPSGEFTPEAAEQRMQRYLIHVRSQQLVEEYGLYLARRNPELAIQLFTDDACRVRIEPAQLTQLLKEHAPGAVQQYLEYLVFQKGQRQYTDDLIGYYLDSMLSVLERSEEARNSLAESYSTYRALSAPKPTYLTFITQNSPQKSWWQSRLRLLQLLSSGSSYASSSSTSSQLKYSVPTVLARLAPFSTYLVSESIILDARQGHHSRAIDSLTHGLGDYDTAVRYCYFGGPPPTSSQPIDASELPDFTTQKSLFNHLLSEFLKIESHSDRMERTSDLLAKFAAWFDPMEVLASIPMDWSIDLLNEFFLRTLRKLRTDRDESMVIRGLAAAENLRKQVEFVEGCEKLGAFFEDNKGIYGKGDRDDSDDGQSPSGGLDGMEDLADAGDVSQVMDLLSDHLVVS